MDEILDLAPVSSVLDPIIEIVVNSVRSAASRRVYRQTLVEFLSWYAAAGHSGLNKAVVHEYRSALQRRGLEALSSNLLTADGSMPSARS